MTKFYIGQNKGQETYQVTSGTSSTGKDLEVSMNLSNITERDQVTQGLKDIFDYFMRQKFPPA